MSEKTNLNRDKNSLNIISGKKFVDFVIDTCVKMKDLLSEHCGPDASDAMIVLFNGNNYREKYNNLFTNDGITIISSIEYANGVQHHISDLLKYIGNRIDDKAKDGTTSTMYIFLSIIEHFFRIKRENFKFLNIISNDIKSSKEIINELNAFIDFIESCIEDGAITIDNSEFSLVKHFNITKEEAIRFVAYNQAMISSKFDHQIARAICDVVESLPEEFNGMFTVNQIPFETSERFTVEEQNYDFMFNGTLNQDYMNYKLDTQCIYKKCDILVIEDALIPGSMDYTLVMEYLTRITNEEELKNTLLLMCPNFDSQVYDITRNYNRKHKNKIIPITAMGNVMAGKGALLFKAILACSGKYSVAENYMNDKPLENSIIRNASFHYKDKFITINNIYKKTNNRFHPFYLNRNKFRPYTELVDELKARIEELTSGNKQVNSGNDDILAREYINFYRKLVCVKPKIITISGARYECLTDFQIIKDSFGAVLSSIESGFILDGVSNMYLNCVYSTKFTQYAHIFRELLEIIHTDIDRKDLIDVNFDEEIFSYRLHNNKETYYLSESTILKTLIFSYSDTPPTVEDLEYIVLVQPIETYSEMIKRFKEVLPKIINSSKIIIPDTVNTEIK
jgi:hypothetical protein